MNSFAVRSPKNPVFNAGGPGGGPPSSPFGVRRGAARAPAATRPPPPASARRASRHPAMTCQEAVQSYTSEEKTDWLLREGPGELTHLMWRMDEADWSMKQLGSRMNQAEYEATKEGGRYHEACAQYHFLCKEVNGIKGENSTMAAKVEAFDKIAKVTRKETQDIKIENSAITAHLQLIDRMNKNTQKQHLNKIEFLEQRIKEQDERIKQLEQIIKGGMQCDAAADDVSMSDAAADDVKIKMKQLEHMIRPDVDVGMGSTGSS